MWGGGGGTVDVHAHVKIYAWPMGRRSTPSVGRLTVLHVVGVVRLQVAWLLLMIAEWSLNAIQV